MKRYKIFVCLSALLLVACADEDIVQDNPNRGDALELRAEISQQYTTRANDGGFADGDQIGVFIVNYKNDETQPLQPTGNHADNVRFTYDEASGKWTGSYQIYWKDKTTPIDAYGYYPFDADLSSTQAYPFSVQLNQRDPMKTGRKLSGYEASDFLWAKKEGVLPTAGAITLQHHHLMAGIKIILKEGEFFEEGEWNSLDKTVLIENTITESTINLQTGVVTPVGITTGIITPLALGRGAGEEASFRAVVIPQTVAAASNLFSITVGGKSYQFNRQEPMVYYSRKLHQFTFEVQKSLETGDYQFNLISESVTPWDNDPESHNGSAREYVTVHVEEGQFLGDVIKQMEIDPMNIINLKLTGTITGQDTWYGNGDLTDANFCYIRDYMPNMEAVNLKELRTKAMIIWNRSEDIFYGFHTHEDDFIPMNAFENINFLQYVVWPDSLKGIGCGAFAGTGLRGSLILPEGMKFIGNDAFAAYGHMPTNFSGDLYIPSTVEYIGDGAFGQNDGQNTCFFTGELVLPEHMTYLGGGAFGGCPYLTGLIHIPDGLTEVNRAFAPNMTAKVVRIPQGVKKVNGIGGQYSSIVFPEGVEEIHNCGSSSLTTDVHLPSTIKRVSGFGGSNFAHINLPEGLEFINDYTFYRCTFLQDTVAIPSTVIQIGNEAFAYCEKLNAVVLPEYLEEIKDEAFMYCRSLSYIRCLNPEPPVLDGSAFNGVEKNECTLVVPEGSVEAYRNAVGWQEFKRISTYQNFVCRPMKAKLLNKANTRTIVLNSDGNWKVTSCPTWIHPSKTNGNKKSEITINIDALPYGDADREGEVVFTLTDKTDEEGNAIICTYTVQQFDYEYDEDTQVTLQQATKGNTGGINIVFVGDGYDAEDIAKGTYIEDMREGMEYFFAIEPYKTYQNYFNVYADMAMSYESGVQSTVDVWRQTKFGTTYGSGENGRLGTNPEDVFNYVLNDVASSAITASNLNQSLIICVPNDDAYEGITTVYESGAAVAFIPHSRYDYPNDYRGLIQHEAGGHGFGKLGDEYIYHRDNIWNCPCVCCAHTEAVTSAKALGWYRNLSLEGRYKMVEWTHLIFDPRYGDIVDVYEGGYMHGRGIYRSEVNSCMNNNVPYYSTISRQAIVERIMQYSGGTFSFEQFVANDSRAMGEKFLTRSGSKDGIPAPVMHSGPPVIINGSPFDHLKKKGVKR